MTHELTEALRRLQNELAEHPRLNSGEIESLKQLAEDIHQTIHSQTGAPPSVGEDSSPEGQGTGSIEDTLSERVQRTIEDFEAHHPQLTKTLSMIAERLADMGI